MDYVKDCEYDNISLSRVMTRVFSLKSTPLNMWVMWVYIVWVETPSVSDMTNCQNRMFRGYLVGRPYSQDTRENQLSWLFAFQSCVEHMLHFVGSLLTSYPRKHLWSWMSLESSHSLSHTTLTMKSHIKYRVQKIEQNYNQIWYGIKANTN